MLKKKIRYIGISGLDSTYSLCSFFLLTLFIQIIWKIYRSPKNSRARILAQNLDPIEHFNSILLSLFSENEKKNGYLQNKWLSIEFLNDINTYFKPQIEI